MTGHGTEREKPILWPMRGIMLLVCGCSFMISAQAQDSTYCTSTVLGQGRPKAFEFNYGRIVDYSVDTRDVVNDSLQFKSEVRRNRRIDIKARVPLLIRPDWKISLGLGYLVENYSFEKFSGPATALLEQLENRPLRSLSTTLSAARYFKRTYLLSRFRASLDHDGVESPSRDDNPIKYTAIGFFGWKRNENTTFGGGLAFAYLLGRAQLLPIVGYSHTFNRHFGIELLLPQSAKARFNLGDKNLLYVAAEIEGANYNIAFSGQPLDGTFFLERSALRGSVRFERELYDWLWCGFDAGVVRVLNLTLVTDHGIDRGKTVIGTRVNEALFFGASIFIVPPRKMMN